MEFGETISHISERFIVVKLSLFYLSFSIHNNFPIIGTFRLFLIHFLIIRAELLPTYSGKCKLVGYWGGEVGRMTSLQCGELSATLQKLHHRL